MDLLVFQIDKESYGVDIATVHEVIWMQEIVRIPETPTSFEGVVNLRGKVIPVLDLGRRLGLPGGRYTDRTRIVVVEIAPHTVGLIVDVPLEILRLPAEAVDAGGVREFAGRRISILDLQEVVQ